ALVDDTEAELVDVDDVDPVQDFLAGQVEQPVAQVGGEVGVVGGEQDGLVAPARKLLHQVFDPVQGHDGLAGTGAAADPSGAAVGTFDQLLLGGVQEDLPGGEVVLQDLAQAGVGGGDPGGGPGQGRAEVGGVDRAF